MLEVARWGNRGQNGGAKWGELTPMCIRNGTGPFLRKRMLDPILSNFWHQIGPFSGLFVLWMGQSGSKRAQNDLISLVCAPQMVEYHFWKNAFLTPF